MTLHLTPDMQIACCRPTRFLALEAVSVPANDTAISGDDRCNACGQAWISTDGDLTPWNSRLGDVQLDP
jgi:hypothetical protein